MCFKVLKVTHNVTILDCHLNLNIKKCYESKVNLYVPVDNNDVRYYRGRHSPLISNNIGNLCLTFDPVMIRDQGEKFSGAVKLQFVASATCSVYTDYRPYQGLLHLLVIFSQGPMQSLWQEDRK